MSDWINDLFRFHTEQALDCGDIPRLKACSGYLAKNKLLQNEDWTRIAGAFMHTKRWYDAWQWILQWQQTTATQDASAALTTLYQTLGVVGADGISARNCIAALNDAEKHNDMDAVSVITEFYLQKFASEPSIVRKAGLAHLMAQRYVDALNRLASLSNWDDDTVQALAHCLVRLNDAKRAKDLLTKFFGKRQSLTAKLAGIRLLIAVKLQQHDDAWSIVRRLEPQDLNSPCCEDALIAWARSGKDVKLRYQFLLAQAQRFGRVAGYWLALSAVSECSEPQLENTTDYIRKALALTPKNARVWKILALHLAQQKQFPPAVEAFNQSLSYDSSDADCWHAFGLLCNELREYKMAESNYHRAIALQPDNGSFWSNLGNSLLRLRLVEAGLNCARKAVQLAPDNAVVWANLGAACSIHYLYLEAEQALDKALKLQPDLLVAQQNQARVKGQLGEFDEALTLFEAMPNKDQALCSSLLFYVNYHPDYSSENIYAIYRRCIDQYFPQREFTSYNNAIDAKRRLTIGFVSPDFRQHPCFHFYAPLFYHRNTNEYRIIAYSDVASPDSISTDIQSHCDLWRDISRLSNAQVAQQIRDDRVDILVDLAGHTSDNRLSLFALKPAPLQVSYLGYGYTTGLKSIDYFLCDEEILPHGHERVFSEAPLRVDIPCFAYHAPTNVPDIADAPCQRNGFVSFGSLSRSIRLNRRCLTAWLAILKSVPDSHLVLNSFSFREAAMIKRFTDYFVSNGVAASRLDIDCTSPPWPVYAQIDIMLDCFPHNSGTTLFEGLYMGVPFITRRDRVSMGRLGATIARGLGCAEWIADSDEDYILKAVALANDRQQLAALRASLRHRLMHSALGDGAGFTRRVEAAFRQIWQQWCAENASSVTNISEKSLA